MNLDYIFGTIFIVLLVLKLLGVIAISWWLVFAPIFAWLVLALVILGLFWLFAIYASKK